MASAWVVIDSSGESGPEVDVYGSRAAAIRGSAAKERERADGEYSAEISDEEIVEQWIENSVEEVLLVELTIQN